MTDLREELLRRLELDQASLRTVIGERPADGAPSEQLDATLRDNTEWLRRVIHQSGWPGRSSVGEDGATAAFLLAQHSDHDPAFQRECLDLLEVAVADGEAGKSHLAYLTDRVLLHERGSQIYGTQLGAPIEDPEGVNQRRKDMGLGPLAVYRMLTVPVFVLISVRRVVVSAWRRNWPIGRALWTRHTRR